MFYVKKSIIVEEWLIIESRGSRDKEIEVFKKALVYRLYIRTLVYRPFIRTLSLVLSAVLSKDRTYHKIIILEC